MGQRLPPLALPDAAIGSRVTPARALRVPPSLLARSALKSCERCNRQDELHTLHTGGHLNAVAVHVSMMMMEGMRLQGVVIRLCTPAAAHTLAHTCAPPPCPHHAHLRKWKCTSRSQASHSPLLCRWARGCYHWPPPLLLQRPAQHLPMQPQ